MSFFSDLGTKLKEEHRLTAQEIEALMKHFRFVYDDDDTEVLPNENKIEEIIATHLKERTKKCIPIETREQVLKHHLQQAINGEKDLKLNILILAIALHIYTRNEIPEKCLLDLRIGKIKRDFDEALYQAGGALVGFSTASITESKNMTRSFSSEVAAQATDLKNGHKNQNPNSRSIWRELLLATPWVRLDTEGKGLAIARPNIKEFMPP